MYMGVGFSDRVDQFVFRVNECGFVCIYKGS